MTTRKSELPIIPFASREAWETWLEEHHATSDGLWLKLAKRGSGLETVSLAEALDVALCYGWIDSRADSFDDQHWLLRFTPHRPRSKWSQVNRLKVGKLIEEVKRAKAHGRWEE
jgi:uncharacterized protein YdeI (YjbR/CyaY-like superfamily)